MLTAGCEEIELRIGFNRREIECELDKGKI